MKKTMTLFLLCSVSVFIFSSCSDDGYSDDSLQSTTPAELCMRQLLNADYTPDLQSFVFSGDYSVPTKATASAKQVPIRRTDLKIGGEDDPNWYPVNNFEPSSEQIESAELDYFKAEVEKFGGSLKDLLETVSGSSPELDEWNDLSFLPYSLFPYNETSVLHSQRYKLAYDEKAGVSEFFLETSNYFYNFKTAGLQSADWISPVAVYAQTDPYLHIKVFKNEAEKEVVEAQLSFDSKLSRKEEGYLSSGNFSNNVRYIRFVEGENYSFYSELPDQASAITFKLTDNRWNIIQGDCAEYTTARGIEKNGSTCFSRIENDTLYSVRKYSSERQLLVMNPFSAFSYAFAEDRRSLYADFASLHGWKNAKIHFDSEENYFDIFAFSTDKDEYSFTSQITHEDFYSRITTEKKAYNENIKYSCFVESWNPDVPSKETVPVLEIDNDSDSNEAEALEESLAALYDLGFSLKNMENGFENKAVTFCQNYNTEMNAAFGESFIPFESPTDVLLAIKSIFSAS